MAQDWEANGHNLGKYFYLLYNNVMLSVLIRIASVCLSYRKSFVGTQKRVQIIQGKTSQSLRKHAYSNILKISSPKTESFQIKILIFFTFLLKT